MKKSTAIDTAFTDLYVQLVKAGLHPDDAKKKAEQQIYSIAIPEPKIGPVALKRKRQSKQVIL